MLGSITRACAKANYDLLVSFQNLEDDWHAEYEDSNKADGIILLGYGNYTDYQTKVAQLESQGTHFVRWGAPDKAHPGVSIGCDNYQGGHSITEHLISLGKKTFAFIGDNGEHAPEFMARYKGYEDALKQHNLNECSVQRNAISTEDDGSDAVKSLIECDELPEAIVCASDLIAMGALRALRRANISVPNDVAVVGYDNIAVSAYTTPALSTVQQNTKLAGELLVDTLLKAINNERVEDYLMPAEVIIRQSCGNENGA
jgi:DNA-binding LacI/PurR family transcriptional regulator